MGGAWDIRLLSNICLPAAIEYQLAAAYSSKKRNIITQITTFLDAAPKANFSQHQPSCSLYKRAIPMSHLLWTQGPSANSKLEQEEGGNLSFTVSHLSKKKRREESEKCFSCVAQKTTERYDMSERARTSLLL